MNIGRRSSGLIRLCTRSLSTAASPENVHFKTLSELLGHTPTSVKTDTIFVSVDLEHPRSLNQPGAEPVISQVGIATLDTRDIHSLTVSSDLRELISVRHYVVAHKLLPVRPRSRMRPCVFSKTRKIKSDGLVAVLRDAFRVNDAESGTQRQIVLVGHSVSRELELLSLLKLNPEDMAPVIFSADTHHLARKMFPPKDPSAPLLPGQNFSLAGVLAQLDYRPPPSTFHVAGNDAVYTLYAMLLMAIKHSVGRVRRLSPGALSNLHKLKDAVFFSLFRSVPANTFSPRDANYDIPGGPGPTSLKEKLSLESLLDVAVPPPPSPLEHLSKASSTQSTKSAKASRATSRKRLDRNVISLEKKGKESSGSESWLWRYIFRFSARRPDKSQQ